MAGPNTPKRKPKRKSKNEITTAYGMEHPVNFSFIREITVAEFQPADQDADLEIHMLIKCVGRKDTMVMRFKSPDTIGDLIENLNFYRKRAWPDADKIDLEREFHVGDNSDE